MIGPASEGIAFPAVLLALASLGHPTTAGATEGPAAPAEASETEAVDVASGKAGEEEPGAELVLWTMADTVTLDPGRLRNLRGDFVARLERVAERMWDEHGMRVEIVEGYRSPQRQQELFAQGRTDEGPVVTWTRNSLHTAGAAADLYVDGAPVTQEQAVLLARIARQEGLRTLYPLDSGHIQLEGVARGDGPEGPLTRELPAAPAGPTPRVGVAPVAPVARPARPARPGGVVRGPESGDADLGAGAVPRGPLSAGRPNVPTELVASAGTSDADARPYGGPSSAGQGRPPTVEGLGPRTGAAGSSGTSAAEGGAGAVRAGASDLSERPGLGSADSRGGEARSRENGRGSRDPGRLGASRIVPEGRDGGRGAPSASGEGVRGPASSAGGTGSDRAASAEAQATAPTGGDARGSVASSAAAASFVGAAGPGASPPPARAGGSTASAAVDATPAPSMEASTHVARLEGLQGTVYRRLHLPIDGLDGSASLQLGLRGGAVDASLSLSDAGLADDLRRNLHELRQALATRGIDTTGVAIRVTPDAGPRAAATVSDVSFAQAADAPASAGAGSQTGDSRSGDPRQEPRGADRFHEPNEERSATRRREGRRGRRAQEDDHAR